MSNERLLLSEKYKAFLKCDAPVEFLEGTTAAGKTTVGLFKFMLKVAESPKKLHIIAAKDTGTAEKNIVNKDLSITDDFGILAEYNGNGTKDDKIPHILFHTSSGDKVIYVMGYGDKKKWQKALGNQYGCLYIDEINTADIEFIRESAMRCDYLMGTLNPDDPNLPVYKEYINSSRPLPEWLDETPKEIIEELREEPKPGWVHWFFSFTHNLGLSKEKLENIIRNTPKGTKIWKNKIQGLRGKATGLVFPNFDRKKHVVSKAWVKQQIATGKIKVKKFSAALDTSYSTKSPDTIAMIFQAITMDRKLIVLDEQVYNNADLSIPLAPSDTAVKLIEFLERKSINKIADAISGFKIDIPDKIAAAVGFDSFGFDILHINEVSIPKLAQGGFVKKYAFPLAENFSKEQSNGVKVSYSNPVAIQKNGGWRYNYGNMFYVLLVSEYLTTAQFDDETVQAVMTEALKYQGWRYVYGGASPTTSFDCSGLVQWCYWKAGISLPLTAQEQYDVTQHILLSEAKAGDLVFFHSTYDAGTYITHIGIYQGNNRIKQAFKLSALRGFVRFLIWKKELVY